MPFRGDPSRAVQVGFLLLLTFTSAQVAWWITENVHYSRSVETRLATLYREHGATEATREAIAALADERARRINRYLWEGGFFLLVLIGGMSVLTSAIRLDSNLRRRQQNFVAAVSHEFKSPLASIRLAAETLLLRSRDPDTEKIARRILADDDRLLRMVENLLDSAKLESGRPSLRLENLEAGPLVASAVEAIRDRASNHQVTVTVAVEGGLLLRSDRTMLETTLRNLLDNATKSCIAAGSHAITVSMRREGRDVVLIVSDDGLGFEAVEASRVFQKFYRIGDELRRSTQGTGLGLYIVKRLADAVGARVRAMSDGPGRGASFFITWPDNIPA